MIYLFGLVLLFLAIVFAFGEEAGAWFVRIVLALLALGVFGALAFVVLMITK